MIENLVIVESPAKAKTIEKFLGKGYQVVSSMGHIRDLAKKDFGIDLENNYKPKYIVPADKKKIVTELKKQVKEAKVVWLASDEDREGEAIAWHLAEELNLDVKKTRRIVFHEITEKAIKQSLENYRTIDQNLVNAQQARRVLDRLVGFELSPVLWKKVKPSLSAGRVQSVAVRLIVEREREIINFESVSAFRVRGVFVPEGAKKNLTAELNKRFNTEAEAKKFLEKCIDAQFQVADVSKKPSKKSPAAPFTTSTLQQEASRKLGYSVSQTMALAQRLYEAGHITYMRTDSVNLSDFAINAAKKIIESEYGSEFSEVRNYKTKSKGAQEAHEAIRPTYLEKKTISGNNNEKRLYELIWKRTVASQMSDAKLEKTTIQINVSTAQEKFVAQGEVLIFEGFLKVYIESTDDEVEEEDSGLLPPLLVNEQLKRDEINATERFTLHPPRYTEASLVRKLEELGIGRPSTYAPTITTIQNRGYVLKEDRPGLERKYQMLTLKGTDIKNFTKTEITGNEKAKLFPDNIGMIVNDFLLEYFKEILDFNFTASVEKDFDEIAAGKTDWQKMIDDFYKPFHKQVETTLEVSDYTKGERVLGEDPSSGKTVVARMGRYGPIVQIGEKSEGNDEKPKFASILKGQHIETITLEEALSLFQLPREVGEYEGKTMTVAIGRFGPYIRHNNAFVSLKKDVDDPYAITAERAIELIEEKREKDKNKYIKTFDDEPELQILNGRWGPYLVYKKKNFKIPKGVEPASLSKEDCMKIITDSDKKKK
ncbi:MAG: type I DNA topoisomerase [Bacteroidales bacterium]|nr:type I DNA topoisomerase [Bacteroidales bacterium]MBN2817651.1 type I DNA topoisomerase [Bacteroidales bacterium]